MGNLDLFAIELEDNPMAVYYTGQSVYSRLVICPKEDIKVKQIFIKLEGKAHTSWTRHERRLRYGSESDTLETVLFSSRILHRCYNDFMGKLSQFVRRRLWSHTLHLHGDRWQTLVEIRLQAELTNHRSWIARSQLRSHS